MPSLYEISVPVFIHHLETLHKVLTKGEQYAKEKGIDLSELVEARLAPDMKPLLFQIQTCSDVSRNAVVRVAGTKAVPMEDNETTMEQLHERISKTIDVLKAIKTEDFQGKEGAEVVLKFPGNELKFTSESFLLYYSLPNFYFHFTTAYDILRSKGVPVGKRDYLGRS